MSGSAAVWEQAVLAAALIAVDPAGLGGARVRSCAGPVRDHWLSVFKGFLPAEVRVRKLPPATPEGRLLGGIDLAATLQTGRPAAERGLLAEIDGGVLLAVMAERLEASTVAHLNAALDAREIVVERDGLSLRVPSSFAVIALDEGIDDEQAALSLRDRLAFAIDLGALARADCSEPAFGPDVVSNARAQLGHVVIADECVEALCRAAVSLGIYSLRAPLLAVRAAKGVAALEAADAVRPEDVELAARLVLAPRATMLPVLDEGQETEPRQEDRPEQEDRDRQDQPALEDMVLEAAQAAIPPDLLAQLRARGTERRPSATSGKQGLSKADPRRGRPIGARRGELRAGARLNVLETLRAAAPWQPLRRRTSVCRNESGRLRLLVEKEDFRVARFRQRSATSTIFVVDASGSSALQRLAEVKGAVELLLSDCYIRRDEVALISFRGTKAELLLPPTRSLTRAKRALAALPGGGGTPLSTAIDAAAKLALAVRGKGQFPTIVLMTDGRANVSRDGRGGRVGAEAEAHEAARQLGTTGIPVVLVDTSPRPHALAEKLAAEMNARYVALPHADASRLSRVVQAHVTIPDRRVRA